MQPNEFAPCEFSANLVIFQRCVDSKNTPIEANFQRKIGHLPSLATFQLGFGFWSHFARIRSMQNREGRNAAHAFIYFCLTLSLLHPHRINFTTLTSPRKPSIPDVLFFSNATSTGCVPLI